MPEEPTIRHSPQSTLKPRDKGGGEGEKGTGAKKLAPKATEVLVTVRWVKDKGQIIPVLEPTEGDCLPITLSKDGEKSITVQLAGRSYQVAAKRSSANGAVTHEITVTGKLVVNTVTKEPVNRAVVRSVTNGPSAERSITFFSGEPISAATGDDLTDSKAPISLEDD